MNPCQELVPIGSTSRGGKPAGRGIPGHDCVEQKSVLRDDDRDAVFVHRPHDKLSTQTTVSERPFGKRPKVPDWRWRLDCVDAVDKWGSFHLVGIEPTWMIESGSAQAVEQKPWKKQQP